MSERVGTLISYFLRTLFTSLPGALYIIGTLVYWYVLFNPRQGTADFDYFLLVAGLFGPVAAFLITLTVAGYANQAVNYPAIVRLPSRVEYLTAVFLSGLLAAMGLQLVLGLLALLLRGPDITLGQLLQVPPIWLAPTILAAVLALHASDFASSGWSRVYLFGLLAIFLFGQNISGETVARLLSSLARYVAGLEFFELSGTLTTWAANAEASEGILSRIFSPLFWPFRTLADGVLNGRFQPIQALAPAIILLYATILYLLAADLFANKDLTLNE